VALIDRDFAHVWKPMLHTIAAGTHDISQQQTPYVSQASNAGFTFHPGEVVGLDRSSREVRIAPLIAPDGRVLVPERQLPYDALILAVGSEANDFGTPGVAENCFRIDSRLQADAFNREVRLRMLQSIAQDKPLSIGIVGGGATGVELAAELVQLTRAAVAYGADRLQSSVTLTLVESGPRLLAAFPEDISGAVQAKLEHLGVRVQTGTRVARSTAEGLECQDGKLVEANLQVWAAGVKGPAFLSRLDGLTATRSNQLVVGPTLQTKDDPRIFAIGDCASLTLETDGRSLPPTAQVAHQQAAHLIRHLPPALLSGKRIPDFAYRNFGALVSLAEYDAYGSLGKFGLLGDITFRGRLAQFSHLMLYRSHQSKVHGFWKGGLLWLVDLLNAAVRPSIRLD
jgi:NADH dehydrogenase